MKRAIERLDGAAFLELYRAQSDAVLRFFARRVLDPRAAADLTAETFAEAFESRGSFRADRGLPEEWLFGVARKRFARYLASLRLESVARDRLGIAVEEVSDEDYDRIEAMIDFAEIGRGVQAALAALAGDQREAVVLRVVDGLSYRQIAERQACSEQVARARVSRGLRTLARSLPEPVGGMR